MSSWLRVEVEFVTLCNAFCGGNRYYDCSLGGCAWLLHIRSWDCLQFSRVNGNHVVCVVSGLGRNAARRLTACLIRSVTSGVEFANAMSSVFTQIRVVCPCLVSL